MTLELLTGLGGIEAPWAEELRRIATGPVRFPHLVGLFSGIGGFELGFEDAGHTTIAHSEIDPAALAVLRAWFHNVPNLGDVGTIKEAPRGTEVLCAGWPCTDLSLAGTMQEIHGPQSGLVFKIIDALRRRPVPVVVLENVARMRQSGRGGAMRDVTARFEELGYRWAYREVDARSFGLPQRRERVLFVFSLDPALDPREVLFADVAPEPKHAARKMRWRPGAWSVGFDISSGERGLGWADEAIPPLKVGSGWGIPSPPAILLRSGRLIKPDLRDAERLQGFDQDWTEPAEDVEKAAYRWKLVGRAIPPQMALWLALRIRSPGAYDASRDRRHPIRGGSWPAGGWGGGGKRYEAVGMTRYPFAEALPDLEDFLRYPGTDVSVRALIGARGDKGYLGRLRRGRMRTPPGFEKALVRHLQAMEKGGWGTRGRGTRHTHPPGARDAAGVLFAHGDYILLMKRSRGSGGGLWDTPGGGLEPGEDAWAAARRETLEEAGIFVPAELPSGTPASASGRTSSGGRYTLHRVDVRRRPRVILSSEHTRSRWVSLKQARRLRLVGGLAGELAELVAG